jgi:hypothetical protein
MAAHKAALPRRSQAHRIFGQIGHALLLSLSAWKSNRARQATPFAPAIF